MVVDDSAAIRGTWARLVDAESDMSVVAAARNGRTALEILARRPVDVVLLDVEMPEMDGISALPHILHDRPHVRVIMASSLTQRGAEVTIRALSLGAADYVTKPSAASGGGLEAVAAELLRKIRALAPHADTRVAADPGARTDSGGAPPAPVPGWRAPHVPAPLPRAVVVASSTGGPKALTTVLANLPAEFPLPIVIVQHMPAMFTAMLAERLARESGRACAEAEGGQAPRAGHVYVAPGDRHLLLERRSGEVVLALSDDDPVNFCRPSADPLFRSAARVYGAAVVGVILTGMGHDGLEGARTLAEVGAPLLVQDEATSVVWGMPGAVVRAGLTSQVVPVDRIAAHIDRTVGARR